MSTLIDFRNDVKELLRRLEDPGSYMLPEDRDSPDIRLLALFNLLRSTLEDGGLLARTPVEPPRLREVADDIRRLPLLHAALLTGKGPVEIPDEFVFRRDVAILKVKLREMLEYPNVPTSVPAVQPAGSHEQGETTRRLRRSHYSDRDDQLCQRIGLDDVRRLTVAALWKQYHTTWNELRPGAKQSAFRACIYRIRNYHHWLSVQRSKKVVQ